MGEFELGLSAEERDYLRGLLQQVLKDALVEEHRTRTLSYRKYVVNQEKMLNQILGKLGVPTNAPAR